MKETCKRCKEEDFTPWYYSKDFEGHVCRRCYKEIFNVGLVDKIRIGHYSFGYFNDRSLWIEKDDGEGMEIFIEKFEKFIDEFWKNEF
jgi:hypothetical protein